MYDNTNLNAQNEFLLYDEVVEDCHEIVTMNRDSNSPLVATLFVISFLIVCLFIGIALFQFENTATVSDRIQIFVTTFGLLLAVCVGLCGFAMMILAWLGHQNRKRVMMEAQVQQAAVNAYWAQMGAAPPNPDLPDNLISFPGSHSPSTLFPTQPTRQRKH